MGRLMLLGLTISSFEYRRSMSCSGTVKIEDYCWEASYSRASSFSEG